MKKTLIALLLLITMIFAFSCASAEENNPYYVRNFRFDGHTASFDVFAESNCTLALRIYDGKTVDDPPSGESPTLIYTIRTDITADDSSKSVPVSVPLPSSTPKYFYLDWYLESSSGDKLTEIYESARYCEDIVRIAEMTPGELALAYDNLVTWQQGTGTYHYDTDGTCSLSVTGSGAGRNFIALRDDVLAVGTSEDEFDSPVSDLFLAADGRTMSFAARETVITDIEGLTYRYVLHGENGSYKVNKIADIAVSQDRKKVTLTLSADPVEVKDYCLAARVVGTSRQLDPFPIDLGLGAIKATGTLNSSVIFEFYFKFSLTKPILDVKFEYDYTIDDFKITIDEAVSVDHTIIPIPILDIIPGVGIDCNLRLVLDADAMGEIDMKIDGAMGIQFGLNGWGHGYGNDLSRGPAVTMTDYDVQGEIFAGLAIGPEISAGSIFSIGGDVRVGPVFKAGKNQVGYVDDGKTYHACKNGECWGGTARFRFGFNIGYTLLHTSHTIWEHHWDSDPWAMWYRSKTFGDGAWGSFCHHRAYRLTVTVTDTEKNLLDDVSVNYEPAGGSEFEQVSSAKTVNGKATIYIPALNANGEFKNPVTVKGTLTDSSGAAVTAEKAFTEEGYGYLNLESGTLVCEKLDLMLEAARYAVSFHDVGKKEDAALNMPDDFSYFAKTGGVIPGNIPTKSGRTFLGWTTDSAGTRPEDAYHPGSVINAGRDLDLYTVWTPNTGDSYTVVYNPNGGTGAPLAETYPTDTDCRISNVIPTKEKSAFLGWSTFPVWDDSMKLYRPGDLYKDRKTILLYALWQADPVYAAKITYNVNGGDPSTAPDVQYVVADSYSYLSRAVPSWDDKHRFTGWSLSPKSLHANYYPGSFTYIDGDTVFYAIWDLDPYRIIEGAGSVWTRGSGEPLRFRADGAVDLFRLLLIDDTAVDSSAYTVSAGSTVVELGTRYLQSLRSGRHTIRFCYEDGDSDTVRFTVADPTPTPTPQPNPPPTGDSGDPGLWFLCCLAGAVGLILIACFRKRERS